MTVPQAMKSNNKEGGGRVQNSSRKKLNPPSNRH